MQPKAFFRSLTLTAAMLATALISTGGVAAWRGAPLSPHTFSQSQPETGSGEEASLTAKRTRRQSLLAKEGGQIGWRPNDEPLKTRIEKEYRA